MRAFFVFVLILGFNSLAFAEEEIDFLVGDWVTFDSPFRNDGVRISDNGDNTLKLIYCNVPDLRVTGECNQTRSYEGSIHFSAPSFVVNEGGRSPNPTYLLTRHKDGVDKFIRNWGSEKIVYYRIKRDISDMKLQK